jgi:hypothetical protein
MGYKLTLEEIENEIVLDSSVMFDTCNTCNGIEVTPTMNSVDDITFDVICDECKNNLK